MPSTMRAVVVRQFGAPDVLKVEQVPVPTCGEKEVLIKIKAAGVNPFETYIRAGRYGVQLKLPYTPGCDSAGLIEAVGAGVTKFKVGDRVFTTKGSLSTYAEFAVAPENCVWPLPQRLSFAQGAGIGIPYFTAYRCLFQKIRPHPADSILIHGASGAVGLASVQLASALGMTVFGTAGTEAGLELVKKSGAHHVFNHRNPEYVNEILTVTEGKGFGVIFEMLGNINLGKDCELINKFGKIVVIGARGKAEIDPVQLMVKDAEIIGMHLGHNSTDKDWEDMGAGLVAGFDNGTLTPVVDKEYPLEKACDAHRDIIESSGAKGNLILNPEMRG